MLCVLKLLVFDPLTVDRLVQLESINVLSIEELRRFLWFTWLIHKFPNAVCDPLFSTGPHDWIGLRETLAAKETRRNAHVQQERRDLQTRRRDDASVPCWRHAQVPHHRSPHPRYSHQEADHAGRRGKSCWSFSKTEFLLDTANWNHCTHSFNLSQLAHSHHQQSPVLCREVVLFSFRSLPPVAAHMH